MNYQKKKLIYISKKVLDQKPLQPEEISYLKSFEKLHKEHKVLRGLKFLAVPVSLGFGALFAIYPSETEKFASTLPSWTNFNPPLLNGINYFWDLLGDPVKKVNIIYHIPNIVLYSFGVFGVKKLIELMNRKTWLDRVYLAQSQMLENISLGKMKLNMRKGHSLLFVGQGDFIGMQETLNSKVDDTVTISQVKPKYTDIWNFYDVETHYDDLKDVIANCDGENCGEYIFFPVKDDQIFLPNAAAFDLSPYKLDILVQNIRVIEKELKWKPKRVIIVGDKFHRSFVQSEDLKKVIPKSGDTISLSSIAKKYQNVTLLDPSDLAIKKILEVAKGRKIVFRATKDGIKEYKERFYKSLQQLGYKPASSKKGILTIGYDIFEAQTEQQTLARKIDDYYPVVLSKNVKDALKRNGYKDSEFLYVPDLVLQTLMKTAVEQ
jgi:hypothetical protein